jgi:predicted amidohydrolase
MGKVCLLINSQNSPTNFVTKSSTLFNCVRLLIYVKLLRSIYPQENVEKDQESDLMSWLNRFLYDDRNAERRLCIAAVTMRCNPVLEINREKMAAQVEAILADHPDVDLIFFGEAVSGWYNPAGKPELHHQTAEPIPGTTTDTLADLARQHQIHLCFGMSESQDDNLYNAQVLINPDGEIHTLHRKCRMKEETYCPGDTPVSLTQIGNIRTAMLVCSDAASLDAMRALRKLRPELILLSMADDEDEDFFMAQCNARLYDAWIVTANRFGDEGERHWNGHMVVSDPFGEMRVAVDGCERVIVYDLGFANPGNWFKRLLRRIIAGTPLLFALLKNWKQLRQYF